MTDEVFPAHLVKECERILAGVRKELTEYGI